MQDHAQDLAMAAIGKNMTLGGGGSALVFGGLAVNDIAAIGGVLIAIIGLCIQIYYKRRADKRDAELHAAQMAGLRRDGR